ncbi:hypothetical protein F441_09593 [Phytophthora nicotianae CJ01A1]|uniref:Uncharacterized protein n=6 Tax=Phytophthora nicotianae TaxID=4792 RepID=W2Q655_PHYN3|nr:hypothetical protein PPTG_12132 [Phytophthora nicotianae INRA-310]ETI45884.1 hypothetical protein F443_09666 [Phytophthora nicotianae P1569]ETK85839.1 hypothetical protein L915_09460 [Phytophthora nicotianae]ETO74555.1 hypothetical protein F444_09730 [Phytophthora nicotianae P1976]ETP15715.1 hypothetical protein F441_09593 [Phytophthora nicotianae CJ01A1]ETP43749.1 hypothetical protein F442_09571 [Phytophthora nicotianae P10297]
MTPNSDAETVLDEDSPLSPCIWAYSAAVEEQRQSETAETSSAVCAAQVSAPRQNETDSRLQNTHRELQLSPASQLNVLSQISELADAQSRQQEAGPESLRPIQQAQRAHVWAPAIETAKKKKNARTTSTTKPKKQKTTQKKTSCSLVERLAVDMLDWETCSEGDLLMVDIDAEEDQWVYDDISDSDFDT